MNAKAKSNSVITTQVDGNVIIFKVKDTGEAMLDVTKISPQVSQRAMLHGLIQRVSDRAAISRNAETGLPASPVDKLSAMRGLCEFYETGTEQWAMERSGGVGGPSNDTLLLVKALRELYPSRTEEQLSEWLKKRSKADKAALMASESIKPIVERLRAEQGAGVDAEGLLNELSGMDEGELSDEGEEEEPEVK